MPANPLMTAPTRLTLVLVRHGQAGGAPVDGLLGPSLSPLGRRQAARVAKRFHRTTFSHIYCSDMARAFQTCSTIRAAHPDTPFTVSEDIREVRNEHLRGHAPAKGALRRQLAAERRAVARFADQLRASHLPPGLVLLVVHAGLIQLLLHALAGVEPKRGLQFGIHNTSVTIVNLAAPDIAEVMLVNCTRHLLPSQVT